ncbi:hypothetical protein HX004_07465 [Myroides sp. 1354]|uniref:hypothetical protein n=1 Tax=unclassified Myroides TaxID=2642485 RepID=UPI002574ED00|nr:MULTISPECIES: hypothetical protein [unclassified Myroides]MDM1044899.1 hypothetical protein [Myroides sp. R163-1]MDM1055612.1 hypothetical protein [Myroides sp. 1354]MDM1068909.1 hypothetical protein [Myroides sp. 1372]
MNYLIKLTTLASFFLFLGSCNSDDATTQPENNTKYLITKVHSTSYETIKMVNGNGTHIERTPTTYVEFHLTYDKNDQLESLAQDSRTMKNEEVVASFHHIFDVKLNQSNQLDSLHILLNDKKIQSDYFKYENNLVEEFSTFGILKIALKYNNQNQFTTGIADFIRPTGNSQPYTVNYKYNTNKQLVGYNYMDYKLELTYNTGKNPFSHLPLDLTSFIFGEFGYIPLTYKFPNTVADYKITSDASTTYSITYNFNSGNYPTEATVYKGSITPENIVQVITYSYLEKAL